NGQEARVEPQVGVRLWNVLEGRNIGDGYDAEENECRDRRAGRGWRPRLSSARASGNRGHRSRLRSSAEHARYGSRRAKAQPERLASGPAEDAWRSADIQAELVINRGPGSPSDDERGRRDVDPLLGTKLAAQSVGL